MTDRIGQCEFIALHGNPEGPRRLTELLSRPGVDGVAVWELGVRGTRFTLRSGVDLPSVQWAEYVMERYHELIGADPVQLVHGRIDYAPCGWQVAVLDVRRVRAVALLKSVGGLAQNAPSLGWLECDWDLVAVPVES